MRRISQPVITGLVAAVALAVLLPVGGYAAETLVTAIVDRDSGVAARVDGGKLRIGDGSGPLNVAGEVHPVTTGRGRSPRLLTSTFTVPNGSLAGGSATLLTVPQGKRFVITHISMSASLPMTQRIVSAWLDLTPPGPSGGEFYLTPGPAVDAQAYGATYQPVSQSVHVEVPAGTAVTAGLARTSSDANTAINVRIAGYMINAN